MLSFSFADTPDAVAFRTLSAKSACGLLGRAMKATIAIVHLPIESLQNDHLGGLRPMEVQESIPLPLMKEKTSPSITIVPEGGERPSKFLQLPSVAKWWFE